MNTPAKQGRFFITVLAVLTLAACSTIPELNSAGGNFKPLSPEVAALAAAPATEKESKPLVCAIANGSARFSTGWNDFSRTEFTLSGANRVDIPLRAQRGGGKTSLIAYFDAPGQKMIFCPYVTNAAPDERIPCASIYALEDDLVMGIKRTFDIPEALRGGDITCAYEHDALRKL